MLVHVVASEEKCVKMGEYLDNKNCAYNQQVIKNQR